MNKSDKEKPRIDFDYWSELHKKDPEKFEKERSEMIEMEIQRMVSYGNLSKKKETRLRGLQWNIDRVHEKYVDNPMGGCVRISAMMSDSVYGEHGLLDTIKSLLNLVNFNIKPVYAPTPTKDNVVPFKKDI